MIIIDATYAAGGTTHLKEGDMSAKNKQRRGLLAKIHIAKNHLDLDDYIYRDLLDSEFGRRSAADLTIGQLERLLTIFSQWGWRADDRQVDALRHRAKEIAAELEHGEKRLTGLVQTICGVDRLDWCRSPKKLTRLLAALGNIERQYADYRREK